MRLSFRSLRSTSSVRAAILLALGLRLLVAPSPARAAEEKSLPAAEISLRGGEGADVATFTPTAAIEVRFTEPMVLAERIGQEDPAPPLAVSPPLPGSFRWTSQRGGVFTLLEPPVLSGAYRARVRSGLVKADGKPLDLAGVAEKTFQTPPFGGTGVSQAGQRSDADPAGKVQILFNAVIDPKAAQPFLSYRNDAGAKREAVVRLPDKNDNYPFDKPLRLTWREHFFEARGGQPAGAAPAVNRLIVTPAKPLDAGAGWKLVIAQGLPGSEPGVRLLADAEVLIGEVKPYEVRDLTADNEGEKDRTIRISFTKALSQEVTAENIERWIHVEPRPANFSIERPEYLSWSVGSPVTLKGDFALKTPYTVKVEAGLPAAQAFVLAETHQETVTFQQRDPQIGFPEFQTHQLSAGRREFGLLALNSPQVRLRAKLLPADSVPAASGIYQKYYQSEKVDDQPVSGRVDFDAIPGQVIYQQTLAGTDTVDVSKTTNLKWDDILGAKKTGVVLLEAEQTAPGDGQEKRAGAQALVQVTDVGIVWKTTRGGEVFAYVFSLTDAQPLAGAAVRLYDKENHLSKEIKADADGIARFDDAKDATWLAAEHEGDSHAVNFAEDGRDELSLYHFNLNAEAWAGGSSGDDEDAPSLAATQREILFFSERGVYQPGDSAHVKAIVREWNGKGLSTPKTGDAVTLRAYDSRGRKFWEKNGKLSANGSLSELVPLPKTGLGRYKVKMFFAADNKPKDGEDGAAADAANDDSDSDTADADESEGGDDEENDVIPKGVGVCKFLVQQYTPNAFELKLAGPKDPPIGAGQPQTTLAARYYMGKTLSKAQVVWSLHAADTNFAPDGFDNYTFCTGNFDTELNREPGEMSLDGKGALSATGEMAIAAPIGVTAAAPAPRTVTVHAEVTDVDQQTVAADTEFTLHPSEFYVGIRDLPEVVRAGDPLPVELVGVRAADGQPLGQSIKTSVKLTRIEWQTQRVGNPSGGSDYKRTPHLTLIGQTEIATTPVRKVGAQWLPADESATIATPTVAALTPAEPGEYLLEIIAKDAAGREALTAVAFDALGQSEADWNYRNAWQAELVPDRVEYKPGEEATILVKTPISGKVLVTVEREGVSRAFVTDLDKAKPAVRVPIRPGDAPNVFVSVMLLRGAAQSPRKFKEPEYRAGYCQLAVSRSDSKFSVEVRAARPDYQPGEEASVRATVRDAAGQPVPGAEVTLYAVDEGILSLTGYKLPDPMRAFFHPRELGVRTGLTLPSLFAEDPEHNDMTNKGYMVGGGGDAGRSDRLRKNFLACAYWNANLVTDAEGNVDARFTAPDGLTRYRIMAVALERQRFGAGEGSFRVNKPLMLEPAMPRFGNVGDHLKLRAVLHNQSETAGEAEINLELDDKAVAYGADGQPSDAARARRVSLAAGETKAVDFPVEFRKTGTATWTWRAQLVGSGPSAPTLRDSVQTILRVDHPTPLRAEVVALHTDAARSEDVIGRINPEVLDGEDGVVQVSICNSRLGELREGIKSLLHYPYGCVEQTTSSLLPWLALKDFGDVLPETKSSAQAEEAVAKGINRLLTMQTSTGGLAYWPGNREREAHPWGSAYGALGMALAQKAGYDVPAPAFKRLCEYLSKQLREGNGAAAHDTYHEHNETDRCLALYALALAGKPEAAYCEKLFADRAKLSPEDRALLALAIAEGGGAADMSAALLQPQPNDAGSSRAWDEFASESSVTGMRLLGWTRCQPQGKQVDAILTALLDQRRGGNWGTTQGNAWALLSLSAYARDVEKNAPAISGEVVLGGQVKPFKLAGKRGSFACDFTLDAGAAGAKPKLSITNPGRKKFYAEVKVESRPPGGAALLAKPQSGEGGYRIERRYQKVLDDGKLAAADDLKVGDRLLVSLDIETTGRAAYVAVDDPLPASLEAINPEFKTQGGGNAGASRADGVMDWEMDFRELREDRAVFFRDSVYPGHFRVNYLARVRAAGSVTAPPAKVEEMYHPERFAETAASTMVSKPLE